MAFGRLARRAGSGIGTSLARGTPFLAITHLLAGGGAIDQGGQLGLGFVEADELRHGGVLDLVDQVGARDELVKLVT